MLTYHRKENYNIKALLHIVNVEQLPGPASYAGISLPLCLLNCGSTETVSILLACGFYTLSAEADLLLRTFESSTTEHSCLLKTCGDL